MAPPSRRAEAKARYRRNAAARRAAWGVTAEGIEGAATALSDIEDRVANLQAAWPAVGRWFADRQRRVFATNNRGRWAPRSASYIDALRRSGFAGRGVMVRTGALRDESANPTPLKVTPRYAVFGIPKGSHLQEQASWLSKGRPSMPRRTAVPGLVAGEKRDLAKVIADYVIPPGGSS